MRKGTFFLFFCLGFTAILHAFPQNNVSLHSELEVVDMNYIRSHPLQRTIKSRTSSSVELVTPPVGNQGTLNSCVGWALCYAGASIRLYDEWGDWNKALCSPSYLFNQYKGTTTSVDTTNCDSVSSNILYLGIRLLQEGTCTLAKMPYTTNCNLQPTTAQKVDALNKRFTVNQFPFPNDTSFYKAALRGGWPVVVGMPMYDSFEAMWYDSSLHGIWSHVDTTDYDHYAAGHAMCVVGYDDTKEAFKVMNSWGTSGGDNGFCWVKYNVVQQGAFREALVVINRDSAKIEGPSVLIDSAWYYMRTIPTGATINWSLHNYSTVPKQCVFTSPLGKDSIHIALRSTGVLPPFPFHTEVFGDQNGKDLIVPYAKLTVTIASGIESSYTTSTNLYRPSSTSASIMREEIIQECNHYTLELWHPMHGCLRVYSIQNMNEQINTENLPKGVYIILLKEHGKTVRQSKIMIK